MILMLTHKPHYEDDRYRHYSGEIYRWDEFDTREQAVQEAIEQFDLYERRLEEQRHSDKQIVCHLLSVGTEYDGDEPRQIIEREELTPESPEVAPELAARKAKRQQERARQAEAAKIAIAREQKRRAEQTLADLKAKFPAL